MDPTTTRRLARLLLLVLCASMLTMPALAAEESAPAESAEETVDIAPTPLENIIEEVGAPSDSPEADLPGEEPLQESAGEIIELVTEPELPALESAPEESSAELDGDAEAAFTVSYYNGETLLGQETLSAGAAPSQAPTQADGVDIRAWQDASGALVDLATVAVEADVSYFAWFMPHLNTTDHIRYINGIGNAKFGPTASLTRAQAAQILYQLLDSKDLGPYSAVFSDVKETAWFATPVKTLASLGVINGYKDGTFRPNETITRAEFVKMLASITGASGGECTFSDVSAANWARSYIAAAAANGWVTGYSDGTFRPSRTITRAEAVVVVNRVLGRSGKGLTEGPGLLHFIDVSSTDWWYYDVVEASVAHEYTGHGSNETWTTFTVESCGLEPGLHKIGSVYVYVDGNRQPTYVNTGINNLGGMYVYASSAGYSFTADLSSRPGYVTFASGAADQALANGFNRIGNTLFYWNAGENAPLALKAGLNPIGGKTYWADAEGYVVRNSFVDGNGQNVSGKGVVALGGKKYLTDGACAIITTGLAYTSDNATLANVDLRNKTYEFEGNMYYIQDDYSLLTGGYQGYLYFDDNGRYTSGDAELDAIIYNRVKDYLYNGNSRVNKLYTAYLYLRGWDGNANHVNQAYDNGFTYRNRNTETFYIDRYNYNDEGIYANFRACAKRFYSNHYGRCYEWGAAYLYLARRLGFQAYLIVGNIGDNPGVKGNPHCWNMIQWDGVWHLSDVETEWGWLNGYYQPGLFLYRNLFDQAIYDVDNTYYYANSNARIYYFFP